MTTPRVEVRMSAGRLRVTGDPSRTEPAVLRVAPGLPSDLAAVKAAAEVDIDAQTGLLLITVPDPPARGRPPRVIIEVAVPVDTYVAAEAGQAQVVGIGTIAGLHARTSSGSVAFEQVTGRVDVRTGRGPVTIHACAGGSVDVSDAVVILREAHGPLTLRARSGDLHAWWLGASTEVATATGNVTLGWAHDRPVRIDVSVDVGRQAVSVQSNPDATDVLSVRTISGDVTVQPATREPAPGPRGPAAVAAAMGRWTRRIRPPR